VLACPPRHSRCSTKGGAHADLMSFELFYVLRFVGGVWKIALASVRAT
jgi:hypothetical protein